MTYGLDVQNQTKIEGVDTTEGVSGNAGYFDFGSFEEFQVGGAGSDAGSFAPGASLAISVKSGGDKFSGNWYSDWQGDATISDNVPDNLKSANNRDSNGFFVRTPLTRGNPIQKQYDVNFNVGGPLWKKKAWWFYSYRLDDQYKFIIGSDALSRSKLTNDYTLKGTFQINSNNQIIGFYNKRNKLQDRRDFGPTTPLSAARYQASTNYPGKIEWTSVLGSSLFLDALYGYWGNFFPLRPTHEVGIYERPLGPGPAGPGEQPVLRRRRQQRLPEPAALQAPVLRVPVVLQGRLEGQPRLQVRLRRQARPAQLHPGPAVRHLLPRPGRAR